MIATRLSVLLVLATFPVSTPSEETGAPPLEGYFGGPYKVAAADFTGDGLVDVLLGYLNLGVVEVAHGDGAGGFSKMTLNALTNDHRHILPDEESWSEPHVHNMAYADLDGDSLPDLLVAVGGLSRIKTGHVILARNAGAGRFEVKSTYSTPSQAKGVALADMDLDGNLDLLYTARGSGYENDLTRGRLYIRRALGNWQFGDAIEADAGKSAYYVETADLNGDGLLDVIVPNEHDSCVTFVLNPGHDIFDPDQPDWNSQIVRATQIPGRRSHAINDVRAADLNGDGLHDLLTANLGTSTVSIFRGIGDGTFEPDTQFDAGKNGAFLQTADFDEDGDLDFVITHWTEDFASVFLNTGSGQFAPRTDYKTGSGNYGVAVADLDNDGHLDIVTANYRERSMSVLLGVGDGTFADAVTTPKGLQARQGEFIRTAAE